MNRKWMLLAAALLSTAAMAADNASTAYSKVVPIGPQDRVSVGLVAGSLNITAWDRNEVDIQGELGSGIDRVDVKQEGGSLEIRVVPREDNWNQNSGKNDSWKKIEANLRVRVPAGVRLEAGTVSASLTASGMRGKTRLRSVSGNIHSDVVGTDMEARSVSGEIDLTGGGAQSRLRAASVSGEVTLNKAAGDVEAKSVSGDVEIEMQSADNVHAASVSGDVEVTGELAAQGELDAEAVSGRIKVTAKAPSGYHYDARSFSGRLKSCLTGDVENRKSGSGGGSITGVLGQGTGTVRVKTHSGNVDLCDH